MQDEVSSQIAYAPVFGLVRLVHAMLRARCDRNPRTSLQTDLPSCSRSPGTSSPAAGENLVLDHATEPEEVKPQLLEN